MNTLKKIVLIISISLLGLWSFCACQNSTKDDTVAIVNDSNQERMKATIETELPLAEAGNAVAQFNVGAFYEMGQEVEQSYEKAFYWYSKSTEQGYYKAQTNLAMLYAKGQGVENQPRRQKYCLKKPQFKAAIVL